MRRSVLFSVLLASALFACTPRNPVTPGPDTGTGSGGTRAPPPEARKDPNADRALQEAREKASSAPQPGKAAEEYMAVSKAFPETTAAQEALYQAGVKFFEAGQYPQARRAFNELLFQNPLFDKAQDAKLRLGLSALQVGAYRDAYQTLSSIADKVQGEQRTQVLEGAARAAENAGIYGEALRLSLDLAAEAKTEQEQKAAVDRVTEQVEGRVPFLDIAKAAQDLPQTHPAWPVLTFKLARIYFHLRDWTRLEETLQRFLQTAPNSPYAQQAQELLARANRRIDLKPRRVGVVLPMTGRYQPLGEAVMRGLKLALDNTDIELVVKDTQGDVTATGKAVEELAFDDGAIAVIGPLLGDDSRRAALVAEELQIPIMTMTRAEGITQIGPHVFRNMLTNSAQAQAIADYGVNVMGFKSWALLYPAIPYGQELANRFWDQLDERGAQVRAAESYSHDQTTFTTEVKKLVGRYYLEDRADYLQKAREAREAASDEFRRRKALEKVKSGLEPVVDFEAIFIPDEWKRVGLVAPALAVEDIITNACDRRDVERIRKTTGKKDVQPVMLFGANLWNSPKGRTGMPELVERGGKFVYCSIYVDGFFADSERPGTQKFVKRFRDKFAESGRDPGLLEAVGYDVGLMYKSVLDKKPATRADFRERLSQLKDLDGATGKTTVNDQREAQKQLFFLTVDNKGVHEISPTAPPRGAQPGT
jgi:ABC-type branched-subunit amino acid transport system substrate-binding protein